MAGSAQIDGTAADVTGKQSLAAMGQVATDSPREHLHGPDEELLESTRVLNQDEIDSLLGFDEGVERNGDDSGIQAIVNSALVSYERLPMLEVVFDRRLMPLVPV